MWGEDMTQHYDILRDRTLIPEMIAFLVSEDRNASLAAGLMIS